MPVIWGLDLREMQWGKFKNSYMWNTEYHLRRTKFIVYQIAMICCVVSESLGTAALSDYVDQQDYVGKHSPGATVHNDDFIGMASYNIFVGIYVATIFGSGFFFDLFWPERHESPAVKLAWRICSVLACLMTLASAIGLTVIIASHSAYVTGTDANTATRLLEEYGGSPLQYRHNGRALASLVFEWVGMLATIASTVILWMSYKHNDTLGPKSSHARNAVAKGDDDVSPNSLDLDTMPDGHTQQAAEPKPAHVKNGAAMNQPTPANGGYEGV